MGQKKCVHYWKVDSNDVGTCIYCGEVKDFGRLQREYSPDRVYPKKRPGRPPGRIGRPKKAKTPAKRGRRSKLSKGVVK